MLEEDNPVLSDQTTQFALHSCFLITTQCIAGCHQALDPGATVSGAAANMLLLLSIVLCLKSPHKARL